MPPASAKFWCPATVLVCKILVESLPQSRRADLAIAAPKEEPMTLKVLLTALVLMTAGTASTQPVWAASQPKVVALNSEQKQAVVRLNEYINSFQTMQGRFTQTSPKGAVTTGKVMIDKPGKMRFEYDNPSPLLIVADGRWLTITNKKKDRGDQFPLNATPLRLVVAPQVNLLAETHVLGFEQADGLVSIALQDKKSKIGGYITLVYDETNQVLQQWMVVDGKGRRTTVQLSELETGVKFDPKLFKVKITRPEKQ
jgi:outer membrane lipoprotein-sorting protein